MLAILFVNKIILCILLVFFLPAIKSETTMQEHMKGVLKTEVISIIFITQKKIILNINLIIGGVKSKT